MNKTSLKEKRLKQREKIAKSELLDHQGLADSLDSSFRHWWLNWLEQQGWIENSNGSAWPQTKEIEKNQLVPVANSVVKKLTLWLGSLPENERRKREAEGQQVVDLKNIEPWGEAVKLFAREENTKILACIETGTSAESIRRWQQIYPQLVWETKGPLAAT